MTIEKNVILREVAGEYILIPTGSLALKFSGVFAISELGSEIWTRLVKGMTEETILSELLDLYEVDEETLTKDYHAFIGQLEELGLIEK
jgi:hypothetical protein